MKGSESNLNFNKFVEIDPELNATFFPLSIERQVYEINFIIKFFEILFYFRKNIIIYWQIVCRKRRDLQLFKNVNRTFFIATK